MNYIEEQLKIVLLNSEDKKETKTLWKKKFISGEVQVKKSQQKIKNPKLKGDEAVKIEAFKDYCEEIKDYKFKWAELKDKLEIKNNNVINTETGEVLTALIEIDNVPEKVVIK